MNIRRVRTPDSPPLSRWFDAAALDAATSDCLVRQRSQIAAMKRDLSHSIVAPRRSILPIFIDRGAPLYAKARYGGLGGARSRSTVLLRPPMRTSALHEGAHSNAAGLDDGEMAGPIVTRRDQIAKPRSDIARI